MKTENLCPRCSLSPEPSQGLLYSTVCHFTPGVSEIKQQRSHPGSESLSPSLGPPKKTEGFPGELMEKHVGSGVRGMARKRERVFCSTLSFYLKQTLFLRGNEDQPSPLVTWSIFLVVTH